MKNCWNCRYANARADRCFAPGRANRNDLIKWLASVLPSAVAICPPEATGCPAWASDPLDIGASLHGAGVPL
jgi:hypothetical protein